MLSEHFNLTNCSSTYSLAATKKWICFPLVQARKFTDRPTGMYCPSSCRKGECWSYKGFKTPLLVLTSLGQGQEKKKELLQFSFLFFSCRSIPFVLNASPTRAGKIHWVRCSPTTLKKEQIGSFPTTIHTLVVLRGIWNPTSWHNSNNPSPHYCLLFLGFKSLGWWFFWASI